MRPLKSSLLLGITLALAGTSGFFVSNALSNSTNSPPPTTTIKVTNGAPGPPGPPGAKGEPGDSFKCPVGFTQGKLVIDHPGGHTSIWTCILL